MIRKDVNDALNNLKKDIPEKKEEKRVKSKFDDMSPDELLNAINKEKESRPAVKKLKRLPPSSPKKTSVPEDSLKKKKRIVIGDLPDYDAISQQETETSEDKAVEPVSVSEEPAENKKGFFSKVKDLMYVSDEDEAETEISENTEEDSSFTVEEIEESTAKTLESISEALSAINDEVPEKVVEPEKPSETEKVPEQAKEPEKKTGSNSNRKKKKKKKKNAVNSGEQKKTVTEPEVVPEKTDIQPEKTEKPEEKQEEIKPEEVKQQNKPNDSGKKNKKKTETEKKDVKEDTEKKTTEEKKSESILDEDPEEIVSARSEKTEKTSDTAVKNGKYTFLALICIILAVIGVIAIINTCISNIGGGKSSKEKFAKAVYPAVIMDINSFENPSELPNDQILSASIWSVILDDKKISRYNERMGVVIIPAVDVENYAVELFGEDIPEITHTTVGPAESKFYYNEEAQSYNIQIKPDTFTYSPEVSSVSKDSGEYIVDVDYVEEHPEWMDKAVSKSVEFRLSKNDNGGYKINSMEILSQSTLD